MLGFVPLQVSLSLNYYLSDYVVSLAARKLGKIDDANVLEKRSRNWKLLFDKDNTLFFRPKSNNNQFVTNFDKYSWMGPYREGGPYQYRFYAPHDPDGLNGKDGYDGKMCDYLGDMMTTASTISNRNKIHEMTEMQQHSFGQYAHNNQPVHHVLYMFAHVGCAKDGQQWLKKTLETQYTSDSFAGDEDNGEQSAWYILSSIGLYSLVPGSGEYQIGLAPPWKKVTLTERNIVINNNNGRVTWDSVDINDKIHVASNVPSLSLNSAYDTIITF